MKWIAVLISLLLAAPVLAHDEDHEHDAWFEALRQPDNPSLSCCGPADHYWCDAVHVRDGKTYCTVTDARDDAPLGRRHVKVGTEVEIPEGKIGAYQGGNPTGHTIVFLSGGEDPAVYCFVQDFGG